MSIFTDTLSLCAEKTEQLLSSQLQVMEGDPAKELQQAMRYAVLNGGKRLRAFLALDFCLASGGQMDDALPYAAGLEMMHASSLIHDDLPSMDNDCLRRGAPTTHIAFGEATALLAGDALCVKSLEVVATNPHCSSSQNLAAVYLLSHNAGEFGICGGQQIDKKSEGISIPQTTLETLVQRKTGALFSASCGMGCIAANATDSQLQAAKDFAEATGLAFQITDDLLDMTASAEELGKTPGKDECSGKNTFPALLGVREAERYAGILCEQAKETLQVFSASDARKALEQYADYILIRKK